MVPAAKEHAQTAARIPHLIISSSPHSGDMNICREGLDRIFRGIKAFIENSPRTKRKGGNGTTFHETMTYFWSHMVHWAIVATKNPKGELQRLASCSRNEEAASCAVASLSPRGPPSPDLRISCHIHTTGDFKTFLLMNPQLVNGGMFLHYYSKGLILHSAEV